MRTAGRASARRRASLGALLDRDGPSSLGEHLARLGEAAIIDSRVLLAHRLGADEAGGHPPRTATPPTSCSTSGSPTRGCGR